MPDSKNQLNIKIDPKLHWLANLAARYWGMTLAEFAESLIARGITREAMRADELRVNEPAKPSERSMLWNESLWSDDAATRLFNLACAADDLLTGSQRQLWVKITSKIATTGRSLTLQTFREYYGISRDGE